MKVKDLNYFLSDEFNNKGVVTESEIWTLNQLIPANPFTGQTFSDSFILISDDDERWLSWNGNLKHVVPDPIEEVLFI